MADFRILEILDQVANEVSGELDLHSVLSNTSRLIKQVVDYSSFVIALIDERGEFDLTFQEGYLPEALEEVRIKADKGLIGLSVVRKEVVIVNDVADDPHHIMVPTSDGSLPRAMIAVPLINKDRAIGAIGIECTRPDCFTEEHRLMMRGIASHLAAAVANAKLYEQTVDQIRLMRVLEQIGRDILSILDLSQLFQEIARLTKQVIDYQAFGIFVIDREHDEFVPLFSIGYDREELRRRPLKLDKGLRGEALRLGRPILANDVLNNPRHVGYKLEIDDVVRSQMYIPLQSKKRVIGILVLGNVRKNFYNNRHFRIAAGMATQIAIAVENATEFEEVVESEEKLRHEIDIARSLQLSMLPRCCPIVPGHDLQAFSRPADNVGGDFYDFIELGEGRLGIVIADVSGTGISSALVMASAREVIRIYSELYSDPAAVMNCVDKRLRKDLTSHMFVAALYGVLDTTAGTFTFCNAGLIEPAMVRNGKASFLDSPGSRLPLGKMADGRYQARNVRLRPDDLIVFTTDGSIEALNRKGVQFGFRRFLRAISAVLRRDAENFDDVDLISRLDQRILRYAGRDMLDDDVTLLTLKVRRDNA